MTPKQDEIEALARVIFTGECGYYEADPAECDFDTDDVRYRTIAAAILAAGYSRTADTLEWAAKVAEAEADARKRAAFIGYGTTENHAANHRANHTAERIAAAIRAGKESS
jgi:hypothetical protein